MTTDPNNPLSGGQVPPNGDPPGQVPNSTPQAGNEPQNQTSNDELLRQIAELRKENAAHRKKNKDAEEAAQAAEQARLAEQGQFKELAAKHEKRVQELEPVAQSYGKLAEQIQAQIETQIKDWPSEVKAFDPGKDSPVEERLAWVEKARVLVDKLQLQAKGQQPGNQPNPRPANQAATQQERLQANRDSFIRQRSYGL